MKITPGLLFATLLGFSSLVSGQGVETEYRDFKGTNGVVIPAALLDKTADSATLLLRNGKRTTVPFTSLSEEDRQYIASWDKEKAIFVQQCRSLTIRQVLELRGYESFPFRFEGNSIFMDGKLNGQAGKFLIDTGAGTSLIHIPFAEKAKCKIGEMTEKIYGVAGEAPAGWTDVENISFGESVFKGRSILATDLANGLPEGSVPKEDAILGADIMSQLRAVISYPERRIFLRPDHSDSTDEETPAAAEVAYRLFRTKDKQTYKGKVLSKTPTVATLELVGGKTMQLPVSRLIDDDAAYVNDWSEAAALFLQHCQSLTIQELLELRRYQSFGYDRRGNHIFVDGTLNDNKVTYMIDTGADNSCLDVGEAKKNNCEVGDMDQWVYGIGGKAPAAVTKIAKITMGDVVLTNRKVLSTDLTRGGTQPLDNVGLFGADYMRELDAVLTYQEKRIFLIQRKTPPAAVEADKKK